MAEKIPPPGNNLEQALANPTAWQRQIVKQEEALRQRNLPPTTVRPGDAPAPPSLTEKK